MRRCGTQDGRIADVRLQLSQLTPREREVFALLIRGKPHKQIAYVLDVSERTVKVHRHNVMEKFQVQSLAELAVIAERLVACCRRPANRTPRSRSAPEQRSSGRNFP